MKLVWPQQRLSNLQLIAIPLVLAIFLGTVAIVTLASGSFPMGRDFKGGSLIRVKGDNLPDAATFELAVKNLLGGGANVDLIEVGFDIRIDNVLSDEGKFLVKRMFFERFGISENSITVETMGPTITSLYSEQARTALICAFVAMGIIIFIVFRRRTPVGAILLCLGLDMLEILGCMALFGIELSLASVSGMLMFIGYSMDDNILMTTRVLKRVGEPREQVVNAMRTGLMMTGTTLIPLFAINLFITAPQLYQLTVVLIFGLIVDIFNTWFLNAAILIRHVERGRRKEYPISI